MRHRMITGTLRNRIDKLWTEFWTGGITNPLTVIEQISFLMFSRLLDMRRDTDREAGRPRTGKPYQGHLAPGPDDRAAGTNFMHMAGDQMLKGP